MNSFSAYSLLTVLALYLSFEHSLSSIIVLADNTIGDDREPRLLGKSINIISS